MSFFNTRNRMNWLVMALIAIKILSISALWVSQSKKQGPPAHQGKNGIVFLKKELDLNPEQVSQISALRADHFKEIEALHKAAREKRRAMFKEINSSQPDSILLVRYAAEIGSSQAAIEETTIIHFLHIKSILTEKQLNQFQQVVDKLLPPPGGPPGHGRHGGPPPPRRRPPD